MQTPPCARCSIRVRCFDLFYKFCNPSPRPSLNKICQLSIQLAEERICADIRTLKELTPVEARQSNQNVRVVIIFYQHMFWPRSCKPLPAPGRGFICISGRSFRKRLTRTCKALLASTLGEVFLPEAFFTRGRAGRLGES